MLDLGPRGFAKMGGLPKGLVCYSRGTGLIIRSYGLVQLGNDAVLALLQ